MSVTIMAAIMTMRRRDLDSSTRDPLRPLNYVIIIIHRIIKRAHTYGNELYTLARDDSARGGSGVL